jgi:hypothetical protein
MQESEGKFSSFGVNGYTDYHGDMSDSTGLIEYPLSRFHPRHPQSRITSLQRGEDPKEKWIEYCKPSCHEQQEVLKRCEKALKIVRNFEADKSCVFRYRQWVECIESCTQPKIFYNLKGPTRRGPLDFIKMNGPSGLH